MMESIYIVGIIALLLIMLVFILRGSLKSFLAKGKVTRGKTSAEGQIGISAEPSDSNSKSSKINPNNVAITENSNILGITILNIYRSTIRFARNLNLCGKMKVTVNEPYPEELPSKPRTMNSRLEDSPSERLPQNDHNSRHLPESEDE